MKKNNEIGNNIFLKNEETVGRKDKMNDNKFHSLHEIKKKVENILYQSRS